MSRSRKPSVFQVGKIRDDGRTVVISGWGLGLCASGCACHRHPSAGHLAIAEAQAGGRLGLASFSEGGCDCCEPSTADELSAILRGLDTVASLQSRSPSPADRIVRLPRQARAPAPRVRPLSRDAPWAHLCSEPSPPPGAFWSDACDLLRRM